MSTTLETHFRGTDIPERVQTLPAADGPYTGPTYYDLPALKASHYGWLITAYFFVGGLASAAQFLSVVVDLFGRAEDRLVTRAGRYLALLGALVSPPLLILDLKTPLRWYNMLRIFRKTSAMSIGSWALSSFGLFSGLVAAGQALEDLFGWPLGRWLARLAGLPAALTGGVVAIYTGTLLAATNVPLWSVSFPYLSSLFASSAASTAVAALSLLTPRAAPSTHRRLDLFGVLTALTELFIALRIDARWRKQRVATPLRASAVGPGWRVGVLGLAIGLPLALHLLALFGGGSSPSARRGADRSAPRAISNAASLAALAGGFILRAVFVFGGKQSAAYPKDYFQLTRP